MATTWSQVAITVWWRCGRRVTSNSSTSTLVAMLVSEPWTYHTIKGQNKQLYVCRLETMHFIQTFRSFRAPVKIMAIIIVTHFAVIVIASPVRDNNRSGVSSYCFCLQSLKNQHYKRGGSSSRLSQPLCSQDDLILSPI